MIAIPSPLRWRRALPCLLLAGLAHGMVVTWDGGGANDNWSTAANWSSDSAPANEGTDTVVFTGFTRLAPNIDTPWSVLGLQFDEFADAFTFGGSTLTLGGGIINTGYSAQTITAGLSLASAQAWDAGDGVLTINGNVANGGNTLTLTSNSGYTDISGVISGSGGLVKTGASGLLYLTGANTFSGQVHIKAGQVHASSIGNASANSALGTHGTVKLGDGASEGALVYTGAGEISDKVIDLAGTTGGGVVQQDGAGALAFTSALSLSGAGNKTFTLAGYGSAAAEFQGVIADGVGVTSVAKTGWVSWTLTGNNTYTGNTTLTEGALLAGHDNAFGTGTLVLSGGTVGGGSSPRTIANPLTLASSSSVGGAGALTFTGDLTHTGAGNSTLTVNNAGATTFSGDIAISNSATNRTLTLANATSATISGDILNGGTSTGSSFVKSGLGTLTLTGANTYGGSTTVNSGTLLIGSATALPSGLPLSVEAVAGGSTVLLDLDGYSATVASLALGGAHGNGAGSVANLATGAGTLTLAGDVTFNVTGNPLGSTLSGNLALGSSNRTFTIGNSSAAAADLTVSALVSSTGGGLTKAGAGTLVLSGANTYDAVTTVSAGTLEFATIASVGGGASNLGAPTTAGNGAIALGGGTLRYTGSGHSTDRAVNLTAASTLDASGSGTLTFDAASGDSITGASQNLTLTGSGNGAINDAIATGAGTLTKAGTGTWTLAGANTYTGATTVNGGTLLLGSSSSLANSALTINSLSPGLTALLGLDGYNATVSSLTFGGTSATSTSTNNLTTGAGTLTLAGNVTYLSTNNPLGSTLSGNLALGASTRTFTINDSTGAATDLAVSAVISSIGGGLTKAGAGTLVLSGANTYDAVTTVSAGTLEFSTIANVGGGASNLGAPTTAGNGAIALGGTLRYTGSGHSTDRAVNLTAASTIDASGSGTLTFDVASGSAVTATNQNLTLTGSGNGAVTDPIALGTGTLTKAGTGTWTLAGVNTYTGATTINRGTLLFGAGNVIADTSAVTVNSTTAGATALLDLNGFNDTLASLTFGGTSATSTSTNNLTTGAGTLTLAGNVTYLSTNNPLGSTLSGNLALGAATRTFTVNDSTSAATDLAVSAAVSSTGGGLTKAGAGTMLLSGTNTYTGATTVNRGTLRLGSSSSLPNTALTVQSTSAGETALVDLNGFNATVASLTFSGSSATNTSTSNLSTGAGTLTLGGAVTYAKGVTNQPLGSTLSGNLNLGAAIRTFTIADSTNAAHDLTVTAAIASTAGGIAKAGAGTLLLSDNNQHTGGTTVTAGTLALGHDNAAGTGTLTLSGGSLVGSGGPRTLANTLSLTASTALGGSDNLAFTGTLTNTASNTLTLTNAGTTTFGAINLSNSATNRTLSFTTSGGDVAVTGIIANGGGSIASALFKNGVGTLTLTGANTYAGATTVQGGVLSINSLANVGGGASALGTPTITANGTIALGSTTTSATLAYTGTGHSSNRILNLAGTTGGATLDASGTGALTLTSALTASGAGSKTLTLTGTSTSANAINGAIVNNSGANTTALLKTGAGTWELGGANTFTGGVTLSAGTLTLKSGASLATTNALTVNGGTLNLGNASQTIASLTGSGGTIDFGTGHTLTVAQITSTTYSGVLAGDGTLALNGSGGTLTLSGGSSNTHTTTTVAEGTLVFAKTGGAEAVSTGAITVGNGAGTDLLRLEASHQIGNTVALTLAGGAFNANNFTETLGTLSLSSGGTIDFGSTAGVLAFADSSAQSWSGTLTIANYTTSSNTLRFGTSASALTGGQLAAITFTGYAGAASIDASGYVSPIPEPATYAVMAGLAGLALAASRRRRNLQP